MIQGHELESHCRQECSICVFFGFRSLQLQLAHENEINHDIHLASTLF